MSIGPLETTHGPRHSEDLADLTRELCLKRFPGYVVERYGTNGQGQHGVDVRAYKAGSPHKLFQCKRRVSLTTTEMDSELQKAESYPFPKDSYKFYTTIKHDKRLQDHAVRLSEKYKIPISIEFWEEIKQEVLQYDDLKKKFFGKYLLEIVRTDSVHVEVDIFDTRFDFVVSRLPDKKRFGDRLLLVTSLQTKKACYYRFGDYYYNFVPITGLGKIHAFVLWKWFEQFSSFDEMCSCKAEEFHVPESEVSEFLTGLRESESDDE